MNEEGILRLSEEEWKEEKAKGKEIEKQAISYLKFGREWGCYDFPKFEVDLK